MKKPHTINLFFGWNLGAWIIDMCIFFACISFFIAILPSSFTPHFLSFHEKESLFFLFCSLNLALWLTTSSCQTHGNQVIRHSLRVSFIHFLFFAGGMALMQKWIGPTWLITAYWGVFALLFMLKQLACRFLYQKLTPRFSLKNQVVICGTWTEMSNVYRRLNRVESGYCVNAFLQFSSETASFPSELKVEDLSQWEKYLMENPQIKAVFLQSNVLSSQQVTHLVNYCLGNNIDFYEIPVGLQNHTRGISLQRVADTWSVHVSDEPLSRWYNRAAKRIFDLLLSLIYFLTVFPILYIVLSWVIKRVSAGPAFQKRTFMGQDKQTWKGICFRTTHAFRQAEDEDPSVSFEFGNRFHASHWDELPLAFYVLLGKMSWVGPRYHILEQNETIRYIWDEYHVSKYVKPAVLGCGYALDGTCGVQADIEYLQHWSLWLDIKILFQTLIRALRLKRSDVKQLVEE